MSALALQFHSTQFDVIDRNNQHWLRVNQIGLALGYKNPELSVNKLYRANSDEFTSSMTSLVELETKGGKQQVRVFSLRGCHLLAMFSRTKVAKDFRQWVLDILDKETHKPSTQTDQPKLEYATKTQREPLVKAVRKLTLTAQKKGRVIGFSDAHSLINMQMGVDTIEHLSPEQIPEAMKIVGTMLKEVIMNGEYIPKGEADPIPESVNPTVYEKISYEQRQKITKSVNDAMCGWVLGGKGTQPLHNCLRVVFSIERIDDLPVKDFDKAIEIIEEAGKKNMLFLKLMSELKSEFIQAHINQNAPWTSDLKNKYKKLISKTFPSRPDWQQIKNEIESKNKLLA